MMRWHSDLPREYFRGIKGALRIPLLSFQFLRRPGCTTKLLCFHIAGGFDPHRPYQLSLSLHRTCEIREAAKGSIKKNIESAGEPKPRGTDGKPTPSCRFG